MPPKKRERVELQVAVEDSALDQIAEVARRLRAAGMDVEQQLEAAGVITGTIEADKLAKLARIKGVAGVERTREIQLPPPGSPAQ